MRPESLQPPVRIEGERVRLETFARSDFDAMARAWALPADPRIRNGLRSEPDPPDTGSTVRRMLERQPEGAGLVLAVVPKSWGEPVGVTELVDIQRARDSVGVGDTWLTSGAWRATVYADVQLLLLRLAFDIGGAHRVSWKIDVRDTRSREQIARLGATQEAILREDLWLSEGFYRDTVVLRVLRDEWPTIGSRLHEQLKHPAPSSPRGADARVATGSLTSDRSPRAPTPFPQQELGFRSPVTLTGRIVQLQPLDRTHLPEIEHAGRDPAVWQYLRWGADRPVHELAAVLTDELLDGQAKGEVLPFVIRLLPDRRVIGVFRFLNIDRPNRGVELGTWVDSEYWRTPVNTEVKYLAMAYAFERERAHRVQLQTDQRNTRSQRAIERLGAFREGTQDEHMLRPDGTYRTSIVYSILESEWHDVKQGLEEKLARGWALAGSTTGPGPAVG